MMRPLLDKELRLALHPTAIIFLGLSLMLLIPNYPYLVTFFYTGLAVFFTCLAGRENGDILYTVLLPIRKTDAVKARMVLVVLVQLAQIATAIPVALLRHALIPAGNAAGMDANVALFGSAFILFGLFNYTFFTTYYRAPDKVGRSFLIASSAVFAYIAVTETAAHTVPFVRDCLDTRDPACLGPKLVVLAVGLLLFALLTWAAYRRAARSFVALDL